MKDTSTKITLNQLREIKRIMVTETRFNSKDDLMQLGIMDRVDSLQEKVIINENVERFMSRVIEIMDR